LNYPDIKQELTMAFFQFNKDYYIGRSGFRVNKSAKKEPFTANVNDSFDL